MNGEHVTARLLTTLVAILALAFGAAAVERPIVRAEEESVTVQVANVGTLAVRLAEEEVAFLTPSGANAGASAVSGSTVYAEVAINIEDSRADGERPGYRVGIGVEPFTEIESGAMISPERFAVATIDAGELNAFAPDVSGLTLSSPVVVFEVPDEAEAIIATISIYIRLSIPAGMAPGMYSGQIILDVLDLSPL